MSLTTNAERTPQADSSETARDQPGTGPHAETASENSAGGLENPASGGDGPQLAEANRKTQEPWDRFLLFNVAIPILLIVLGAFVYRLLGKAEPEPLPPPDTSAAAVLEGLPSTIVEPVRSLQESNQKLELIIDGTVVPFREAVVSSEVAGRVTEKSDHCEAGAIVSAGDLLMKIDSKDYELEVERLTRLREQEYRALGELDQEMLNTQRSIEVAEEDVELKQKELERQKALKTFASEAEVDRARGALLQANQQLLTLRNQLDLLRSRRSRLEASEQLAATQLSVAELNLRRCEIKAPISGVIVSEQADLNTFVSRGTPLITIEDIEKVEVSANMRMDQLHWVVDQEATVPRDGYDLPDTDAIIEYEVSGRPGVVHRWRGTLLSYDGIGIDPATRTVPVRIVVDDPTRYLDDQGQERNADRTNALLRGMFVRVRLQLNPRSELVIIPAKALRPGNRVWKFTPDEQVLQQRIEEVKRKVEELASTAGTAPDSGTLSTEDDADSTPNDDTAKFDASEWKAGLVRYSKAVYPIDSLRVSSEKLSDTADGSSPAIQSAGRLWICQAEESDIASGDYVVISPLDSIPPDGLPARAQTEP